MFYGDNIRWWVGQVLQQHPSQNLVRVKIHGIHGPLMTAHDHPWATIMIPSTEGGTSGLSRVSQLNQGAYVFGIFLDGATSQSPMVMGALSHIERPTREQLSSIASGVAGASNTVAVGGEAENVSIGTDGIVVGSDLRSTFDQVRNDTSSGAVNTRRLIAMLFLTRQLDSEGNRLFTPEQAAGIVGNLQGENNNFDPTLQSSVRNSYRTERGRGVGDPQREPSFGIAQWNANVGRYQNLVGFAESLGPDYRWDDFFVQLRFIIHELIGSPGNGGSTYNSTYQKMIRATTHTGYPNGGRYNRVNSTWIWLDKYENPADKPDIIRTRERFAEAALSDYHTEIQNTAGQLVGVSS